MGQNMRITYLTLIVCISSLNESTGVQNPCHPIIAISYTGYQDLGEGLLVYHTHMTLVTSHNQLWLGYHAHVTTLTWKADFVGFNKGVLVNHCQVHT